MLTTLSKWSYDWLEILTLELNRLWDVIFEIFEYIRQKVNKNVWRWMFQDNIDVLELWVYLSDILKLWRLKPDESWLWWPARDIEILFIRPYIFWVFCVFICIFSVNDILNSEIEWLNIFYGWFVKDFLYLKNWCSWSWMHYN